MLVKLSNEIWNTNQMFSYVTPIHMHVLFMKFIKISSTYRYSCDPKSDSMDISQLLLPFSTSFVRFHQFYSLLLKTHSRHWVRIFVNKTRIPNLANKQVLRIHFKILIQYKAPHIFWSSYNNSIIIRIFIYFVYKIEKRVWKQITISGGTLFINFLADFRWCDENHKVFVHFSSKCSNMPIISARYDHTMACSLWTDRKIYQPKWKQKINWITSVFPTLLLALKFRIFRHWQKLKDTFFTPKFEAENWHVGRIKNLRERLWSEKSAD